MNYKDALELCIEVTGKRIEELGARAAEIHEEMASSDDREEWAALRSAQGGMMECLDLMQQFLAMAKSFDSDPAGIQS
jgi:hypothetical protein